MLKILQTTVYRGPNVWARMPVIHYVVDIGELEDRPTNKIPGFYEHLTEYLPSLYEHGCSLGRPGGFLQRMREGTWMGHVAEHIALALQAEAGHDLRLAYAPGPYGPTSDDLRHLLVPLEGTYWTSLVEPDGGE